MRRFDYFSACFVFLAIPSILWADEFTPLPATIGIRGQQLHASFDVSNAFTEGFRQRLSSGLLSQALIEIAVRTTQGKSIGHTQRRCKMRLDMWDDLVRVQLQDGRTTHPVREHPLIDDGIRSCGVIESIPILDASTEISPLVSFYLEVTVSLNPISPELLERTREFTANPRGGSMSKSRNFFTAVARLFSSSSQIASETFYFRSSRFPSTPVLRNP